MKWWISEHAAAHSKQYMSQICDTVMSCFYRLLTVDKQSNVVECGSVYWLHGFSVLQNTKRPAYGGSHTVASLNNAPADGALEIPRVLV